MHFHVIWLDGVYSHEPGRGGVEWCGHAQVTDADVALLVRRVRDRVRRKLRQMGKLPEDRDAADADVGGDPSDGEQLLLELDAAAVQGVALSGERAGQGGGWVGLWLSGVRVVRAAVCFTYALSLMSNWHCKTFPQDITAKCGAHHFPLMDGG